MEKKNTKGFIGLFLALASVALIVVAYLVPMAKLTGFGIDGKMSFYNNTNAILIWISVLCAVAAIVFGIMSRKHKDKKGPRKSGVIIGIICIILGLFSSLIIGMFTMITDYINSDGQSGFIAEALEKDSNQKEAVDKFIKELQKSAGVPETGVGAAASENSKTDNTEKTESSAASEG